MEYNLYENNGNGYQKIERYDDEKTEELSQHYRRILDLIGEDSNREGLLKTPLRVAKAMQFFTQGYKLDPVEMLKSATFHEHHLLPFFGKAHVAYIPNGQVTGLSKLARVVDAYARRLQVQERLTTQIRDCIQDTLQPLGVAVVIEAQHMCMQMRGIQKQNSVTTTSDFTGAFLRTATREEFIHLITARLH
jgi:GTP cyclohydrolase I